MIEEKPIINIRRLIAKCFKSTKDKTSTSISNKSNIIARVDHSISRDNISGNALKVLYRLHEAGYAAYLVGGGVRDLLLGQTPKDFDVATDAKPEEVADIFRNCRLIGRRFRLAHVYFKRDIIEVATFRGQGNAKEKTDRKTNAQGFLTRDNVYGSIEDDAFRRDFTINALYYNIADFSVVDFTNGLTDLRHKTIRLIGEPTKRIKEDPLRMLRAVRIAAKINFTIDKKTLAPFQSCKQLLSQIAPSRLFDEVVKMFKSGNVVTCYQRLSELDFFEVLFPHTAKLIEQDSHYNELLMQALRNTDERIRAGKTTTPIYLLAVFLWPCLNHAMHEYADEMDNPISIFFEVYESVLKRQQAYTQIPKFFTKGIKEIWLLQFFLERLTPKSIWRTYSHPRFRAAYDFYLLRAETRYANSDIAEWWTAFQIGDDAHREQIVAGLSSSQSTAHSTSDSKHED